MILLKAIDEKGREFTLEGDLEYINSRLQPLYNLDPDDEEYGINHIVKDDPWGDERYTAEERKADEEGFQAIQDYQPWDWLDLFEKIPKKKNGTFAKGRVIVVHRGYTFGHYWEDSYGWNAPELRIKTLDDFTAELTLDYTTVGY
ncbi:hypothetical protein ABWK22_02235 [Gottfriedia acidiceleris]|uniref:hypothetical protein n=1 Tax=Gottfriedia acidiceleris TaxID=371036 RepID=UPI0033938F05